MRFLPPICQPVSGICVYNVLFLSVAYGTVAHPIFFLDFLFLNLEVIVTFTTDACSVMPAALRLPRFLLFSS